MTHVAMATKFETLCENYVKIKVFRHGIGWNFEVL